MDAKTRVKNGLLAFGASSPRKVMVILAWVTLTLAFAGAAVTWRHGTISVIRLFHFWLTLVQGDDSWHPMRVAYGWYMSGHSGTIYQHVLFDQHIKFQYPPSSLLVFAVPDALHIPVSQWYLNFIGWLSVLAEALGAGMLSMVATRGWRDDRLRLAAAATALFMALTFYPVLWAFQQGQIQAWFGGLFTVAVLCFFTNRKALAGVLIGAICLAKPQFLVFLPWALLRREWSFAGAMVAVVAVTLVGSVYYFGWQNQVDYITALSFMGHHGEAFVRNYSVNGVMNRLLGNGYAVAFRAHEYAPYNPLVYWTTTATSVAFIAGALFYRWREKTNLVDFLIAAVSLTIASPIAWEHHYNILPPAFVILALTLARPKLQRRHVVSAGALIAAFLACDIILPPIEALMRGPGSLLQATVFFGALTVLALLYRWRDDCPRLSSAPAEPVYSAGEWALPALSTRRYGDTQKSANRTDT